MVKGAVERCERLQPNLPTLTQRLKKAIEMEVGIQCCSQTMANKGLKEKDLIPGVKIAGL